MSGPGMGFTGPQIGAIPNQNIRLGQMLQGQGQPIMGAGGMAPSVMPMMQPPQGMPNTQFPLNPGIGMAMQPPQPFGLSNNGPHNPGMLTNGPIGPNSGHYKALNAVPNAGIK